MHKPSLRGWNYIEFHKPDEISDFNKTQKIKQRPNESALLISLNI